MGDEGRLAVDLYILLLLLLLLVIFFVHYTTYKSNATFNLREKGLENCR